MRDDVSRESVRFEHVRALKLLSHGVRTQQLRRPPLAWGEPGRAVRHSFVLFTR